MFVTIKASKQAILIKNFAFSELCAVLFLL
nr:MAG TPA: hypothetical protein [Caudoviricetes sp.]